MKRPDSTPDRWVPLVRILAGVILAAPSVSLCRAAEAPAFDVDVTLTNDFDKSFTDLPVFLQLFRVFGRGVDYAAFNPKGFHVIGADGAELPLSVKPVPPDFSLANDEIVFAPPTFRKGEALTLRITNTRRDNPRQADYDGARLVANPNNLIPNGGFENGAQGWKGGAVVGDVTHSGRGALLLETPGAGGHAKLHCAAPVAFVKGRNYYFGAWAKCENVVRRTWRYHMSWGLQPISARLTFSGDPLVFPEYDPNYDKSHLVRLMDDRDWYCYEASALSTLCTPQPALATCESTLSLSLDQEAMPYLDTSKPARVWLDDVMLFEQPRVAVSWERTRKRMAQDGFFLYRRAPTCLTPGLYPLPPLDPPRPYEKIAAIAETAAQAERKTITLGVHTLNPIAGLCLDVSDLRGPGGAVLGEAARDIEFHYTPTVDYKADGSGLEGWVLDGNPPRAIDRPGFVDYLIGYRIPADADPGTYRGTIKVKGDGRVLGEVPLTLEVAGFALAPVTDRFAGLIYNAGCGPERPGVTAPGRDAKYYRYYSRNNFPYLMMFCRFIPFKGETADVDIPQLLAQMKELRDVAGCTAGVGVYHDVSLDKQGNNKGQEGGHGLWTRCGRNPDAYRARVKEMDDALAQAGLPRLVYMIWDEPRFCDPVKFGILKGTGAATTCDITFREACESLKLGLFTDLAVDGPGADYGPAFRKYAEKCGARIGWDTQFGPLCNRYQTGLMLAHGGTVISDWHSAYYIVHHTGQKTFARSPSLVGAAEGMVDFRYLATLRDAIARAKERKAAPEEIRAAEEYLKPILGYCTDDFHFMSGSEIFTYNGGPEQWGDDWFYDRWRDGMRRHIAAIQHALR